MRKGGANLPGPRRVCLTVRRLVQQKSVQETVNTIGDSGKSPP